MKSIYTIIALFISSISASAQCPASAERSTSTKCVIVTYPSEPATIYDSLDFMDSPPVRYYFDSKDGPGTIPFTVTYKDGTPGGGCGATVSFSDTIIFYKTVALTLVSDTCVYASGVLPLTLLGFNGKGFSGVNEIKWSVSNVVNVYKFTIEKMQTTKGGFETIHECNYIKGYSEYSYLDQNEIDQKSLYRLKIVDFDGATAYSPTLSIINNASGHQSAISVFPNPSSGQITLKFNSNAISVNLVYIKDLTGRIVREIQIADNSSINVSLEGLSNGLYLVQYGSEIVKFEKK